MLNRVLSLEYSLEPWKLNALLFFSSFYRPARVRVVNSAPTIFLSLLDEELEKFSLQVTGHHVRAPWLCPGNTPPPHHKKTKGGLKMSGRDSATLVIVVNHERLTLPRCQHTVAEADYV